MVILARKECGQPVNGGHVDGPMKVNPLAANAAPTAMEMVGPRATEKVPMILNSKGPLSVRDPPSL